MTAYRTLTGCGASTANESYNVTCGITYGNASSYPQSTTGNISGIFDMSGGAYEYVMGNYNNTADTTYFQTLPSSKYYDVYISSQFTGSNSTNMTFCTLATCGGHALYETSAWYNDDAKFISSNSPWFERGGATTAVIMAVRKWAHFTITTTMVVPLATFRGVGFLW